jgi:hypothetical protein
MLSPDRLSTSSSFSSCIILPMISFYLEYSRPFLLLKGGLMLEVGVTPFESTGSSLVALGRPQAALVCCSWFPRRLSEHEFDLARSKDARSMDSLCEDGSKVLLVKPPCLPFERERDLSGWCC